MRFPLPGPNDLVQAAAAVRDGVGDALDLVPRLGALLGETESLVGRIASIMDRIEGTVDRADNLLSDVAATEQAAGKVVTSVETTVVRASTLLALYDDSLHTLAPSVQTLAESLEPAEVAAMVTLVDRLPILLEHLDSDVLPILTTLDRVGPELHQLLEIAQDVQVALGGLPGMGWVRKRAEKEEAEAEEEAREVEAATGKALGKPKT